MGILFLKVNTGIWVPLRTQTPTLTPQECTSLFFRGSSTKDDTSTPSNTSAWVKTPALVAFFYTVLIIILNCFIIFHYFPWHSVLFYSNVPIVLANTKQFKGAKFELFHMHVYLSSTWTFYHDISGVGTKPTHIFWMTRRLYFVRCKNWICHVFCLCLKLMDISYRSQELPWMLLFEWMNPARKRG